MINKLNQKEQILKETFIKKVIETKSNNKEVITTLSYLITMFKHKLKP